MEELDDAVISIENLNFSYYKNDPILQNVTLSIKKGEITAFVGPSGCGKTTLCYLLKGIIPHEIKGKLNGSIKVVDFDVKKTKISKLARTVGMVFQDLNSQIFSNTVLEEVEFGLKNLKMDINLAKVALQKLGIEDLSKKIPMNLSAGQKQRVIIASVLAMKPEIIILDEPSIHLDPKSKLILKEWIYELNKNENITIIIASNDPFLIGNLCESILLFDNKTIKRVKKSEIMEQKSAWGWSF